MSTYKIEINLEQCQAHGMCVAAAPKLFGMRPEDSKALPLVDEVSGADAEEATMAADGCPELAISLRPVGDGS